MLLEAREEHVHVLVALEAAEAASASRTPRRTQRRIIVPPSSASRASRWRGCGRSCFRSGSSSRASERGRESQADDGERLVETFAKDAAALGCFFSRFRARLFKRRFAVSIFVDL